MPGRFLFESESERVETLYTSCYPKLLIGGLKAEGLLLGSHLRTLVELVQVTGPNDIIGLNPAQDLHHPIFGVTDLNNSQVGGVALNNKYAERIRIFVVNDSGNWNINSLTSSGLGYPGCGKHSRSQSVV